MELPSLSGQQAELLAFFRQRHRVDSVPARVLAVPYRICPLGAHLDHQGGPVLGRNINAYTLIACTPIDRPEVRLFSTNFPEPVEFPLPVALPPDRTGWGRYARGAAFALGAAHRLRRGLVGAVHGTLPGGGLSSSASVGLAYLSALALVNDLHLDPDEGIDLDCRIENEYLGLNNGILDPGTIVLSRPDAMLYLDTRTRCSAPSGCGATTPKGSNSIARSETPGLRLSHQH